MDTLLLEAQARDIKASPMYLRRIRQIPAVYYGHKEKTMPLQVEYQAFRKTFKKAGMNQIVELTINGKKTPVLIHEVQYNYLTDRIDHIDFIHVNMNEEVTAMIPVEIVGVAPAVKEFGAILTTLKHEIEVRCLPAHLPQTIKIDVSSLVQLHGAIHIKDLVLPKEVKVHGAPDDVVVTVIIPKVKEEAPEEQAAAPVEGAAVAEGAAPAEGAAAPAPVTGGKKE